MQGAIMSIEKMENGLYLFTYEQDGCIIQRVFADPEEKVDISSLKREESVGFNLLVK